MSLKTWRGVRHVRYAYWRWRLDPYWKPFRHWYGLCMPAAHAAQLDLIWRGEG